MSSKPDRTKLDQVQQQREGYIPSENAAGVIKLNGMVPNAYSRPVLEYDGNNNLIKATFFDDDICQESQVTCEADVANSLNNTYFVLESARDIRLYHVWYNVSSGGTDPSPASSTPIEVTINTNDPAQVVALATKQAIDAILDFRSTINVVQSIVEIQTVIGGATTATSDNNTGFTFDILTQGNSRLVRIIELTYDGNNNLLVPEVTFGL